MMRGDTGPLMVATLGYDAEAIKVLLAHGAEVDLPNVFRITPLMAAAGMTGSFRSNIDPVGGTTPPPGDIQLHAMRVIDLLLDGGANINARVILCASESADHAACASRAEVTTLKKRSNPLDMSGTSPCEKCAHHSRVDDICASRR